MQQDEQLCEMDIAYDSGGKQTLTYAPLPEITAMRLLETIARSSPLKSLIFLLWL